MSEQSVVHPTTVQQAQLERLLGHMKTYIDGEITSVREEFTNVLASHVAAIHELRDITDGLKTEMTLSMAFDGDAYRRFLLGECVRMDVRPSELAKVKREDEGEEEGDAGARGSK